MSSATHIPNPSPPHPKKKISTQSHTRARPSHTIPTRATPPAPTVRLTARPPAPRRITYPIRCEAAMVAASVLEKRRSRQNNHGARARGSSSVSTSCKVDPIQNPASEPLVLTAASLTSILKDFFVCLLRRGGEERAARGKEVGKGRDLYARVRGPMTECAGKGRRGRGEKVAAAAKKKRAIISPSHLLTTHKKMGGFPSTQGGPR